MKNLWKSFQKKRQRKKDSEKSELYYQFLPSALEIADNPCSPAGQKIIRGIFIFVVLAVLWASIGKVDEVAVARGKLIPDGRLQIIQPQQEGVITGIFVTEGERVKKGQRLIEFDTTLQQVDEKTLETSLHIAVAEKTLLEKDSVQEGEISLQKIELPNEIEESLIQKSISQRQNYEENMKLLELLSEEAKEQMSMERARLEQIRESIPVLEEREKIMRDLRDRPGIESVSLEKIRRQMAVLEEEEKRYRNLEQAGAIARQAWKEKEDALALMRQEYLLQQTKAAQEKQMSLLNWQQAKEQWERGKQELILQEIQLRKAEIKLQESITNQSKNQSAYEEGLVQQKIEKQKQIEQLQSELKKARTKIADRILYSPVHGVVQGIHPTTIGGVVTPAQPVMSIVPENTPLLIEAMLPNKDIGFVHVGQEARIKIDTFSFQKYGTIKGIVQNVSPDAIEDEKMGLLYKIRISPEKDHLLVEGRQEPLSAGMAVTVEVKTGKRRIIEFFLEPLVKYMQEGLQVR